MLVATREARAMLRYIAKYELVKCPTVHITNFTERYAKDKNITLGEATSCFEYLSKTKYIILLSSGENAMKTEFALAYSYYHWFTFALFDILKNFGLHIALPATIAFITAFVTVNLGGC